MNILLVHGLGRTPLSMWGLARALQKAGHDTELFGYVTLMQSFDEIADNLRDRLQTLSQPGSYGIVTHSMGGILTRAALANSRFRLPQHVVMLAPPNTSPRAARIANRFFPFRWFANQSGQNMATPAFYDTLPALSCPYTLIAGTLGPTGSFSPFGDEINDLIVGISEIRMKPTDPIVQVPALHSFIMNNDLALQATLRALSSRGQHLQVNPT
ncbi:MAG: alpha/beta fold hydrolase [Cyanobacteria bacterium J06648_10]